MEAHNRRQAHRYLLRGHLRKSGRASWRPFSGKKVIRVVEVNDVSFGGLSFYIESDLVPELGERIAMEFNLSKEEQIAWFGEVVRLERDNQDASDNRILVGVKFQQLPLKIQKHIESKLQSSSRSGDADVSEIFPVEEKTILIEVQSAPTARELWTLRAVLLVVLLLAIYGATRFAEQIIDIAHDPKKKVMWPIRPEK